MLDDENEMRDVVGDGQGEIPLQPLLPFNFFFPPCSVVDTLFGWEIFVLVRER